MMTNMSNDNFKITVHATITPVRAIREMTIHLPWYWKHRFYICSSLQDRLSLHKPIMEKQVGNKKRFKNEYDRIGKQYIF